MKSQICFLFLVIFLKIALGQDLCPVAPGVEIGKEIHNTRSDFAVTDIDLGLVEENSLDESSGLVQSRQYDKVLWDHNDSGDLARIFAMHENGAAIGNICLLPVPKMFDHAFHFRRIQPSRHHKCRL